MNETTKREIKCSLNHQGLLFSDYDPITNKWVLAQSDGIPETAQDMAEVWDLWCTNKEQFKAEVLLTDIVLKVGKRKFVKLVSE